MNTIPEERALSPPTGEYHGGAGSTGTWTRSGIRMGSGLLLQSPPSSVAPPPQQQPLHTWFTSSNLGPSSQKENNEDEQEEEASDWEQVKNKKQLDSQSSLNKLLHVMTSMIKFVITNALAY